MNRQKVTAEPIFNSYGDADKAIREWSALDDEVEMIAKAQQDKINGIKQKFEQKAEPMMARKIRLEKDLQEFAEYHKLDFEKSRSKKLTFGKIGFRVSSELKPVKGFTWKTVLAKLKELGRTEFVKTSESVKRAEIKKAPLDAAALKTFGCHIFDKDEFFFEPDRAAVANAKSKLELVTKAA